LGKDKAAGKGQQKHEAQVKAHDRVDELLLLLVVVSSLDVGVGVVGSEVEVVKHRT
jgi:hypothetical protein